MLFHEQIEFLKTRGIKCNENTMNVLENISYADITRFADFYYNYDEKTQKYDSEPDFDEIVDYFNLERELKMELFKYCEMIEMSLKVKVSSLLEAKCYDKGYLDFFSWCDKEKFTSKEIKEMQDKFRETIEKKVEAIRGKRENARVDEYFRDHPNEKHLSIGVLIDLLTFDETIYLYSIMEVIDRIIIANAHHLDPKTFLSHLEHASQIKQICIQGKPIIDLNFDKQPKQLPDFKKVIIANTRRIVKSIFVIVNFIKSINEKNDFSRLKDILDKLIKDDKIAQMLGANDKKSIFKYIDKETDLLSLLRYMLFL